jgi:hypothetical protein
MMSLVAIGSEMIKSCTMCRVCSKTSVRQEHSRLQEFAPTSFAIAYEHLGFDHSTYTNIFLSIGTFVYLL